jgi:chromosome segregation ATPase
VNRNAPRRSLASHADRLGSETGQRSLLDAVEGCQRLLETQRMDLASLRGAVQTVEAAVAAERRFRQEEGDLARQVQSLREGLAQRDRDLRHFHDRCADLERSRENDRRDQHDHLEWIRHLYTRVAALEARALPPAPAAPAAPAASALTQAWRK